MLKLSARREKIKSDNVTLENIKIHNMKTDLAPHDNVMSLDAALLVCQDLHICLIADGYKLKIWHPGVVLPRAVNRVLRANTNEVLRLIGLAHVSVCPSPELHAHSWHYTVKRDCCDLCARLNHWMDGKAA